jgi:hypothetical protein
VRMTKLTLDSTVSDAADLPLVAAAVVVSQIAAPFLSEMLYMLGAGAVGVVCDAAVDADTDADDETVADLPLPAILAVAWSYVASCQTGLP